MHQRNYRQVVIGHLVQNRKRETSEESAADRSRNQVPSLRIGDNLCQRMLHLTYEIRAQADRTTLENLAASISSRSASG